MTLSNAGLSAQRNYDEGQILCSMLKSGAAGHSLGFEDEDLGSSPGWWAATVATYCPSRPGELPKSSALKPSEVSDAPRGKVKSG